MFYEQPSLLQMAILSAVGILFSAAVLLAGKRMGLFSYAGNQRDAEPLGERGPISLSIILGLFVFSLGAGAIALMIGAIAGQLNATAGPNLFNSGGLTQVVWLSIVTVVLAIVIPMQLWYSRLVGLPVWRWLWKGKERLHSILVGLGTLVVAWPVTMTIATLVGLVSVAIFGPFSEMQLPILQLRMAMGNPVLATLMILQVVVLGPVIEEIFFRGYFQGWMRRHLERGSAIFITSLFFAVVHFRMSQGLANLQIVPSIFILGLFLGHLFEKERSLLASIFLHAAFNATTVILLLIGVLLSP